MSVQQSDLEAARARADAARRDLGLAVDDMLGRFKPLSIAGNAIVNPGNLISWGLTLYRFRATATGLIGLLGAAKAKAKGKEEGRAEPKQAAAALPADRAPADRAPAALSPSVSSPPSGALPSALLQDGGLKERIQAHPVAIVAGGVALGLAVGMLVPAGDDEESALHKCRTGLSKMARNALDAVENRLDDLGVNKDNARQAVEWTRDALRDAADAVRDRLRRNGHGA